MNAPERAVANGGKGLTLWIPWWVVVVLTAVLAALGALAIWLLHGAGDNGGQARPAVEPPLLGSKGGGKLWATTIPNFYFRGMEGFPPTSVDEFKLDITNPNPGSVTVNVVRYPGRRGDDHGSVCSRELRARSATSCGFRVPPGSGAIAVLIAAPVPIAIVANAIFGYRREFTPTKEAAYVDVPMPVQVHEVK